jgi:predicted nucleic acid-binding protein
VIFVDTSFWVAFSDGRDPSHVQASFLAKAHEKAQLITTNHVLGETWTFLRRRNGHRVALEFLERAETADRLDIVVATPRQEQQAWAFLRRHDERSYSFVDATSFAVMRHLRIHEALAFDTDFTAAGFVELRA